MTNENAGYEKKIEERTPSDWADIWKKELAAAKKWMRSWHAGAQKIEAEYLAQAKSLEEPDAGGARFNVFWANIQVLLAAVYAKLPAPEVDRTHLDQDDDVARVAATILERIFMFELKNIEDSPDNAYREAIKDRFVAGLGQVWPRYEYREQEQITPAIMSPEGVEMAPEVKEVLIVDEAAPLDFIRWEDFIYSPCRTWEVRRWMSKRVYMTKSQCVTRFGEKIAGQIAYKTNYKSSNKDDPMKLSPEPLAEVFEIWDKESRNVFWVCTGCPVVLDIKPDPLKLQGFFPAKRPLIASTVSAAFLPRPDYAMVQDQYEELNILSTRARLLSEALKVVGVYDKTADGVQRMLNQAVMNELIPVDNWAMFAEKGGIKGCIDWMPLEAVVKALEQISLRKQALMQEIYEILGLSDIMRGQSIATETATAQQLKAQYGSARMQRVQTEIAEFVTSNVRTRGEIICNHWTPEAIIERSQAMYLSQADQKFIMPAIQLLKTNKEVALRLSVQADTLAAPDWNSEKQERIDFLQAVSQFIGMSMPLIQTNPGAAPFLIQMLQWAATGFRAGKQIEGVLDQAMAAMQQTLANPPPPKPPGPKDMKDKASAAKLTAEAAHTNTETAMLQSGETGVQAPPGEGGPGRPPSTALPGGGTTEQQHAQTMEALKSIAMMMSAPKQVVRGPDGRIAGVALATQH